MPADYGSTAFLYTAADGRRLRRTDTLSPATPASRAAHALHRRAGPSTALTRVVRGRRRQRAGHRPGPRRPRPPSASGSPSTRPTRAYGCAGTATRRPRTSRSPVTVDGARRRHLAAAAGQRPCSAGSTDEFDLPAALTAGSRRSRVTLTPPRARPPWTAARYDGRQPGRPLPRHHRAGRGRRARPGAAGGCTPSACPGRSPSPDDVGVAGYRVYASRNPDVPITPANLVGTTRDHRVPARPAAGRADLLTTGSSRSTPPATPVRAVGRGVGTTRTRNTSDVDGDGRDDAVAFTRGDPPTCTPPSSDGTGSCRHSRDWHDFFAVGDEVPLTGDFNGDGRADIVTFTRGDSGRRLRGAVHRHRLRRRASSGTTSSPSARRSPRSATSTATAATTSSPSPAARAADVYVALSTGSGFGPGIKWHDHFAFGTEMPAVGDFDGDGRDDIVTFTRGAGADVFVVPLRRQPVRRQDGWKWHDSVRARRPSCRRVGDFDGDGARRRGHLHPRHHRRRVRGAVRRDAVRRARSPGGTTGSRSATNCPASATSTATEGPTW